jgi:hypothetical protein
MPEVALDKAPIHIDLLTGQVEDAADHVRQRTFIHGWIVIGEDLAGYAGSPISPGGL